MKNRIVKRYFMARDNNTIDELFRIINKIKEEFGNITISPIPDDIEEDYCIPIYNDGRLVNTVSGIIVEQDGTDRNVYKGQIVTEK